MSKSTASKAPANKAANKIAGKVTSKATAKVAAKKPSDDALPDSQTIETNLARIRDFAVTDAHGRVIDFFHRLAHRPPQVILIEGGTTQNRLAAADYWLLLLNCPHVLRQQAQGSHDAMNAHTLNSHAGQANDEFYDSHPSLSSGDLPSGELPFGEHPASDHSPKELFSDGYSPDAQPYDGPCLTCPTCIRFATHLHRDCFFLDGTEGSIKIGTLRDEVRPVLGEPPREAPYRGVIFHEAQYMTPDAANIMLKSLEEPVSATSFLLLTPQRERLLPTLVSRSMVLTLPWSTAAAGDDSFDDEWEEALCQFLLNGQGLISKTGQRGALDIYNGQRVINLCRRKLAQTLTGRPDSGNKSLSDFFSRMPASHQRIVDEVLAQAQDMLLANVSPATVIEWATTRFFLLLPRKR